MMPREPEPNWLVVFTRFLLSSLVLHVVWEVVQLPIYTLWRAGTAREIAFAHCTAGDVLIAALTLVAAIALVGRRTRPIENYAVVAACAITLGISYTVFSEWLNPSRNNWAYSSFMPVVPVLGVGLSPLVQWLIAPAIASWCAVPAAKRK